MKQLVFAGSSAREGGGHEEEGTRRRARGGRRETNQWSGAVDTLMKQLVFAVELSECSPGVNQFDIKILRPCQYALLSMYTE
jgi:hypothetical protein